MTVNKHMPAAQALAIFERFATELYTAAKQVSQTPAPKKHKRSQAQKANRKPVARFIIVYLVEYVGALRLSQHQRRSFVKASKDLFEQFIQPSLEQWMESKTDIECTALPAIQIHFSLTNTLFDVYWKHLEEDQREWLATVLKEVFKSNFKRKTQSARISVVTSVDALLQHAYFASLVSENTPARQTSELVNTALDAIVDTKHEEEVSWDGTLVHLDSSQKVNLACWKLITDEWFDVVCRFVSNEHAEKISSITLLSLVHTPNSENYNPNVLTFQVLNKTLLRSANFYEARCLKDHTIKTLVKGLIELFRADILEQSSNPSTKLLARSIIDLKLGFENPLNLSAEDISRLRDTLEPLDAMDEEINDASTKCVDQIAMFMKLFSLFPMEYYDKAYRRQAMALSFYADAWVISNKSADSGSRIKASLVCRNLQARLISTHTVKPFLVLDPKFLNWFVHSINELPTNNDLSVMKQLSSLKKLTSDVNRDVLSLMLSHTGKKSQDASASDYVEQILKLSVEPLKKHDKTRTIGASIWMTSIIETLNSYIRTRVSSLVHNKMHSSLDINDTVYASKTIASVGCYVIESLDKAKEEVSEMLELVRIIEDENEQNKIIMDFTTEFIKANHVLVLAHLLQDYVHNIGSAAESVVDTAQLSKKLVTLSSPFIQFMQASLRPSTLLSAELKTEVLNMTTAFIAAFCMTLSRYQQVHTTKRVIAVIWFVYSMVSKSGDQASIDSLSATFSAWIQTLSKEEYEILIKSFIEESEEETAQKDDIDRLHSHQVFLSLLKLVVLNSTDAQKNNLKKWIPKFVLKQSLIVGKTRSLELLSQTILLLINVTYDNEYSFSSFDMSLILSCLLQIASPNAPERFGDQLNKDIVSALFDNCCDVLANILRNHRDSLIDVMPTFLGIIQSLLHCFKSTHLSLITKKRKSIDKKNGTDASESLVAHGKTIALFAKFAPLDDSSAEKFARLLSLIPQKNPSNQKSNSSVSLALWRSMPRYVPYVLMEYFTIQSNSTMSIARPQIKAILTPSLYEILDMCTDADRSLIMTALDGSGKSLFKTFFASWKDTHKYTGQ
ncbi:Urb2/Npa2 family-domain-containing protein [Phycomyces blakesleeanus]